jgi:hypothetical protein
MKLLNLATALILGCGIPLSIQTLAPLVAVAGSTYPEGSFEGQGWQQVTLRRVNNRYNYRQFDLETETSIELSRAYVSAGTAGRRIYTWQNQDREYQVVWQAQDPDCIRVKVVVNNSGKTISNSLFYRIKKSGK